MRRKFGGLLRSFVGVFLGVAGCERPGVGGPPCVGGWTAEPHYDGDGKPDGVFLGYRVCFRDATRSGNEDVMLSISTIDDNGRRRYLIECTSGVPAGLPWTIDTVEEAIGEHQQIAALVDPTDPDLNNSMKSDQTWLQDNWVDASTYYLWYGR